MPDSCLPPGKRWDLGERVVKLCANLSGDRYPLAPDTIMRLIRFHRVLSTPNRVGFCCGRSPVDLITALREAQRHFPHDPNISNHLIVADFHRMTFSF